MDIDINDLYAVLAPVARNGDHITYGQLSQRYCDRTHDWHEPHESWDAPLAQLNQLLHAVRLPPLSVVVVHEETGEPGDGFWESSPNVPSRPVDDKARSVLYVDILADVITVRWRDTIPLSNTPAVDIEKTLRALHATRNDPYEEGKIVSDLAAIGDVVVASLVSALASADSEVRLGAAFALGEMPFYSGHRFDITAAIPVLMASTDDRDPWVAFHATKSLWTICGGVEGHNLNAEQIVRKSIAFLENSDPTVRVAAVKQLRFVQRWRELVIPRLIDRLDDQVLEVRFAAAYTLCEFGDAAREALPRFMEWVNSEIPEESFIASVVIIKVEKAHREDLVPRVLESFAHLGSAFRVLAVCLLGEILKKDHRVFPLLVDCYKQNDDRELRLAAVGEIAGFDLHIKEGVQLLAEAIHDEDREVACTALNGLKIACVVKGVGPEAAAVAVPHLIEVLDAELARDDTDIHFISEVCDTLGHIGQAAQAALPCLRTAERSEQTDIKAAAQDALKRIRVHKRRSGRHHLQGTPLLPDDPVA